MECKSQTIYKHNTGLNPLFGLAFNPYPLFQCYLQSNEIFIKSQYEMLKLSI